MKYYILLGILVLSFSGCAEKDSNGNLTAESFSTTGLFNRTSGDVIIGDK